jgi:hypothetical protein
MQRPGLEETLSQWPPAEELLVPGAVVIEAEQRVTLKKTLPHSSNFQFLGYYPGS